MSDSEINQIDPPDRQNDCTGYQHSICCGANIVFGDLCSQCWEHTDSNCIDCDEENCPNRNFLN